MSKNNYQAILVLGVGIDKNFFKNRVDKAVALYKKEIAPKIILSGRCWGGLKKKPKLTEAKAMMKYALHAGVPRKDIWLEEKSLNTAGNFYFTKKQLLKPKTIKKIIVITQPDHFVKAKYLAKKILGKDYQLSWLSDGTKIKSMLPGHADLKTIKRFFYNIKDGDDLAIAKLLRAHPHYKYYRKL